MINRNDLFYKIAHFLSFFALGGFVCRPPIGAGPVSRMGFLNGRTIRINSQKTLIIHSNFFIV
jgi:hypothetical protein